jgi:hypothetical protein
LVLGTGPQRPLRFGADRLQRLEARARDHFLEDPVGFLGVSDRRFAHELRVTDHFQLWIDHAVHPADKKAGDRRDVGDWLLRLGALVQAGQPGVDHFFIALE